MPVEPPVRAGEGDRRRQRPDHLGDLGVAGGGEQFGDAGVKAALVDAAGGVQLLQELRGPLLGVLAHAPSSCQGVPQRGHRPNSSTV
jgi:hypothetical protein